MTPIATFKHNRGQSTLLALIGGTLLALSVLFFQRDGFSDILIPLVCALAGAALTLLALGMMKRIDIFPDRIKITSWMGLHTQRIFWKELHRVTMGNQQQESAVMPLVKHHIGSVSLWRHDGTEYRLAKNTVEHFEELASLIAAHNADKLGPPPGDKE